MKIKPAKCFFLRERVQYLGHIVSKDGIEADPDKLRKVQCWPTPQNVREVQQFLGLANYYRRFIRNFAEVARPLHRLTERSASVFQWTIQCQEKHTRDPVAILVDGFSGHNEKVNDLLGQVTVPPNITSVYQLLDQGIIATLKTGYKSRLLEKVVASVANYNELQVMAKQLPAGSAGLQYWMSCSYVGAVLGDLGLNIIAQAAQKVHDKATAMLFEWLHIVDKA
ncbi:hypothetical protein EMCRGX_G022942 [Ephydatia muelleri]